MMFVCVMCVCDVCVCLHDVCLCVCVCVCVCVLGGRVGGKVILKQQSSQMNKISPHVTIKK